jgi:hypothetical protein
MMGRDEGKASDDADIIQQWVSVFTLSAAIWHQPIQH